MQYRSLRPIDSTDTVSTNNNVLLTWLQEIAEEIPIRIEGDKHSFTLWIGRVETVKAATLKETIERATALIQV